MGGHDPRCPADIHIDGKDLLDIGKRIQEYPDETEQLGVIWSILEKLSEDGVDIGDEGREWVNGIQRYQCEVSQTRLIMDLFVTRVSDFHQFQIFIYSLIILSHIY